MIDMPFYKEGRAKIQFNEDSFLNPKALFLRDMGVALVRMLGYSKSKILDPTAATGIRGIRYYLEAGAKEVTFLDINRKAYLIARKNVKANKVNGTVLNKSIQEFANTSRERFDVIDLDPFGSIAPDLFDIMKLCKDGTLLFLTATDTAVLCGAHEKACIKIYDAKPLHNELCREAGIRLLLGYAARTAAKFDFGIEAILSIEYKHYFRLALRLRRSAEDAVSSMGKLGFAEYCSKCGFINSEKGFAPTISSCPNCKNKLTIAGRMWLGSLYDKKYVKGLLGHLKGADTSDLKILGTVLEELDMPFYYSIPKITKKLNKASVSPYAVADALKKRGFAVSRTQFDFSGIKTDASIKDIVESIGIVFKRSSREK